MAEPRSSRRRYLRFVEDYRARRIDDQLEAERKDAGGPADPKPPRGLLRGHRREYLRSYFRWLYPHRYGVFGLFVLALLAAGLQMAEPLFMRFIVDRVLLNTGARHRRPAHAPEPGGAAFRHSWSSLSKLVGRSRTTASGSSTSGSCCRSGGRSSTACCTCRCRSSGR